MRRAGTFEVINFPVVLLFMFSRVFMLGLYCNSVGSLQRAQEAVRKGWLSDELLCMHGPS